MTKKPKRKFVQSYQLALNADQGWAWQDLDGSLRMDSAKRQAMSPRQPFHYEGGRWVRVKLVEAKP